MTRTNGYRWIWGWTLASAAGWALASLATFIGTWFLVEALTGSADEHLDTDLGAGISLTVAFAIGGAGIGTAQRLLLRGRLDGARSWIWTTVLGWAEVAALYSLLLDRVPVVAGEVLHSLAGGAIAGVLQRRILRANSVRGARWWPAVSGAAFLVAATVSALVAPLVGGDHSVSAIAGMAALAALEGVVLARLLGQVRSRRAPLDAHRGPRRDLDVKSLSSGPTDTATRAAQGAPLVSPRAPEGWKRKRTPTTQATWARPQDHASPRGADFVSAGLALSFVHFFHGTPWTVRDPWPTCCSAGSGQGREPAGAAEQLRRPRQPTGGD